MFSHWSLSDSKSPQVSRTLLSIMAVLSNAVIWIVSTRPPTSKSYWPFNNPLVIMPKTPITIGTIVTFMFFSFFNSLARSSIISLLTSFSYERLLVDFHRSLNDRNSSRVSGTFLCIQASLCNVVFCMVSVILLISNSASLLFPRPWELFLARQQLLISPSQLFQLSDKIQVFVFLFFSVCGAQEQQNSLDDTFCFSY